MPFVWIGVLLIVLKWFDLGPLSQWSWWLVLSPLAIALAWFEVLEPMLGLDRRNRVDDGYARMRESRVRRQFPQWRAKSRPGESSRP